MVIKQNVVLKNYQHPFMLWLIDEPGYSPTLGDLLAATVLANLYNRVFEQCGFPIRVGGFGIIVEPSTYEDRSALDETSGVGRVFKIVRTVLTNRDGLTCLEQPEAGLHPSWHGPLAMLFMLSITGELGKPEKEKKDE